MRESHIIFQIHDGVKDVLKMGGYFVEQVSDRDRYTTLNVSDDFRYCKS